MHFVGIFFVMLVVRKNDSPVFECYKVSHLGLRMQESHSIWRVAVNILNKQSRTVDKGWSSSLESGEVLTTPHPKN
jgi:hypothetical protein